MIAAKEPLESDGLKVAAKMRIARHIFVFLALAFSGVHGQMIVISGPVKDPEVKPQERTATIVHYEQVRATARGAIRVLTLALQSSDGGSKVRVNDAINNEQDIVDSANWCIQALRDKTAEAKACAWHADPR